MEEAADTWYKYSKYPSTLQLRATLDEVNNSLIEFAFDQNSNITLDDLYANGLITSYTTGLPPQQDRVGDS